MSEYLLSGIVDKMKELCQCSICFNIPKENIYNCPTGHSVCQECFSRLRNCPSCEKPYHKKGGGCRNFDKENISKYFLEVIESASGNISIQEDSRTSEELPSTSNGNSNSNGKVLECPYGSDGCNVEGFISTTWNGWEISNRILLVNHTRVCEYRPIECVFKTPEHWKGNTFFEKKRFCGPSLDKTNNNEEDEDGEPSSSGWISFEPRSQPKEVRFSEIISHLVQEHGATFSFLGDPENTSQVGKMDGVFGKSIKNAVWPPHLIPRDGQMFVRQQWIWNNEIQNRIFVVAEPDKAAKYIATIKVSKAVGSAEKETLKTINVLPIRMYGPELFKLGLENPRHDYSVMEVPFAERNYNVKGQGLEKDPTFAWNTWIEIGIKVNLNPLPFNNIPTDGERLLMQGNSF